MASCVAAQKEGEELPDGIEKKQSNQGGKRGGEAVTTEYGWRVKLDHEFASKAGPLKMIRPKQIPSLLSTFFRYRLEGAVFRFFVFSVCFCLGF